MDPYSIYAKQQEYYNYLQKQVENPVDLSTSSQSAAIKLMAERIFSKSDTTYNLYGIMCDDSMNAADIFCMLLEFVLYGLDILTNKQTTIFDITESTDDIIFKIKRYLKSMGFDMKFHEEVMLDTESSLFRAKPEWFYELVPKSTLEWWCPPQDWYVLNYRLIPNKLFDITKNENLPDYKAFFISTDKKLFTIQFIFHKST